MKHHAKKMAMVLGLSGLSLVVGHMGPLAIALHSKCCVKGKL
jgi:hypothetical protein